MLPYLTSYGARRFQCIHPARKNGLYLAIVCRNQWRLGSTVSSGTSSLENTDVDTDERAHNIPKHRRLRFQEHEASNGQNPGGWASEVSTLEHADVNANVYNLPDYHRLQSQEHETPNDQGSEWWASKANIEDQVEPRPYATEEGTGATSASDFVAETDRMISAKDQDELERCVLEALHDEDPHQMLMAFAQASRHPRYLKMLPKTTLSEIIYMLQPSAFIDREKAIYQELRSDHIEDLGHGTPQLEALFESYANSVWRLVRSWKESGKVLGLKEYKALLRVACAAGNGADADGIWSELWRGASVPVDTEAVNLYMEAKCWDGTHTPGYSHTLRYINRNLARRSKPEDEENKRQRGYEGFTVGTFGLRTEMTRVFDDMIHWGLTPDADTFTHLMVAMGREGDMEGVKSILQRVWAINVAEIVGAQDALPDQSTLLSPTSPLYPSERLLYAVAHTFGTNNDVSTALRLVDFISYKYNVPVNLKTWQELVSWTYILSQPRSQGPEDYKVNLRVGQLPSTAFSDLWKIMRSPPYNVEPTMIMHFQRVSNLRRRAFLQPMLNVMREMRNIHQAQVHRYKQCMTNQIRSMLQGPMPTLDPSVKPFFSKTQQEAALERSADLRLERLAEYRDFVCLRRALGFLLNVQRWTSRHGQTFYNVLWQRIGIHNAIAEFGGYMSRFGYRYKIRTGEVQISPNDISMAVGREETSVPGIHAVIDTGVFHVISTRYNRYGSLSSMQWDDISFENNEDKFQDQIEESWPAFQAQHDPQHDETENQLLQHEESQYDAPQDDIEEAEAPLPGPH